jgi:transposase-like protein
MKDLKPVYQAVNKEQAENELDNLELNWGEQYPLVIKSWRDNWHKVSAYFQYTDAIRRLVYTINTAEGYHRQIRKVTQKQGGHKRYGVQFNLHNQKYVYLWITERPEKCIFLYFVTSLLPAYLTSRILYLKIKPLGRLFHILHWCK